MEIEIDTNNLNTQKSEFDQINSMLNNNNNNNNNNTSLSDSNKTIKKKGGGFESMNLIYPVYKAVKSKGFNVPTPIQRKAIPHLLQGRDVVACARTGSGKTAAFIIPMVNRLVEHSKTVGARALLILPTRELALQTVSVLKTFTKFTDLRHCLIVGGHGLEGQFEGLATNPDIIIATPGRLTQHINETGLSLSKVEYLIFDEADYLFEMGFAEQMKTILKKVSQNRQTLIFSATIPQELSQFAKAGLKEYVFCKLDQEYTLNDKMEVNFIVSKPNEKIASLIYLLKLKIPKTDNSILFCPTKYHVDYIMEIFDKFGISNVGIYGKMDQYQRKENIDEFRKSNIQVLVVTDLAARGIDLPNVGNVIQFDFPSQSKIFIHRAGRTARAGRVGKTYCLVSMSEVCYVSEILLYVGRKATNNKEELGNNSKAFCGSIPSYFLNDIQNSIQTMLKDSPDLFKTSDLATKAYQKYTKTRSSASKASIKSSHQIETQKPHPIFQDDDTANKETQNVLEALRSFKPKESALQIYKNKAVKHGHLKVEQVIGLNDAISNMKNIEKIMKQEKDRKIKAKEDQEKLQNEINQRFLKIEKSKQELEQGKIQKEMENQMAEQDLEQNGKKFEEDLEGQEDDGILDDEIELNEEEYNELQQDQKQENGKTEEEQEKKVESQENKEQEKDENENDNDNDDVIKVKSDEEIMRGMTKKQKKQYIKEQAELRRQDPQKFQELQKQKQKSINLLAKFTMDPQNQLQNKKDTSDKQNKGVENQISGDQAEPNNDYTNITAGPIQNHIRGEIITLLPNEKYLILKKNTDKLAKATDQHTTLQCALYNKSLEINDGDLIQADYLPIKDSSDYEYVIVKVLKKSGEKSKPKKPRKYQSILKKPSLIGKPSTINNNYNNNGSKAQEQNQPAIDYKTIDINALSGEEKHTALNRLQFQLEVEEKQLDVYQQSMKQKRPKAPPKPVPDQAQSSIRSLISQRSKQSIIKRAGPIGSVFVTKSQIKKEQSKIESITSIDHSMPLKDLCQKLGIKDLEKGLGHQDAKNKITEFGENKLPDKKRTPGWVIFIHELLTWFSLMLWGGCILSFIGYGLDTSNGLGNVYFAIIIIIIVIITAIITYMQNAKSEALMDSFKNMLPSTCYVLREGTVTSVDPTQLVPGDIISVKAGDKVPADIRVIYSNEMKVDNSPLTGEAIPLLRSDQCTHPDFMESANMAFFGTVVTEGRGKGIVIKTGSKTVLGEIALEVSGDKKQKTPLRKELDRFVIMISFIAIGLCVIFFFAARFVVGYSWVDSMIFGIGILLANVPEGLLGCITISLAITAEILAKKQVLVKNLEGVETLGSTSCICSDKTGTLTQNKMTVEHIWYDSKIRRGDNLQIKPQDFNFEYKPTDVTFTELQICAVTSSEAVFQVPEADFDKTTWLHAPVKGDASETALVKFFQPIEYIEKTRQEHPFAKTERGENAVMPFNSTNKFAMTIIEQLTEESHYTVYIKGAPEKIWTLCTYLMHEGQPQEINKQLEKLFQNVQLEFMNNGERVLGFAQLRLDRQQYPEGFEFDVSHVDKFNFEFKDFTFLGLISLQDPPKPAVPHAVEKCKSAGIKVIMVTGDSPPTAAAISKQVNIIPSNMKTNLDIMIEMEEKGEKITWQQATAQADAIVINGDQINQQLAQDNKNRKEGDPENDSGIQQWVKKPYCVFARTTPQHKLKIVQACQRVGYIVGVTGDGVNDSPAIKQGDIGISMGITGSDVTKDAADMVLLNDDFASIIDGIQEGRKIFDNLKKTIVYLLTSNVTQIIPFIAQLIFLLPLPLSTMLMLTISAGTDILPALSFAYECAEIDIMTRRPRTKKEHMVTVRLITHAYLQMGFISTAAGFFAYFSTMYYYGFKMNGLFGLTGSDVVIAKRGDLIPFGSYNPNLPNLGNPYLNNDCRENGKTENFVYSLTDNTGEKDNWENLDWTFQRDEQYDLRQIIVECDKETGNWITKEDIFKQCEGIDNSDDIGFAQMIENAENDSSVNFPSLSTQEHTYKYYQTENNQKSYKTKVPVCYSTEALKWAQSAYFVAIVLVQWSNIISVKAKKVSFIYTPWNRFMLYGVILETVIAIFLCYTPGVQLVFMTRPLLFVQWWCGSVFSIMLFVWCEVRKYLIRQSPIKGKQNFWAKNVMW